MPDYTIKCWSNKSFDFDSLDFTHEAVTVNQYPAAADYVRLYALYTEGGIYLDSDVNVFKSFNVFLHNRFFCGTEAFDVQGRTQYRMEAAIMGAEAGHPFLKECMEYYEQTHFIKADGTYDNTIRVMPAVISSKAEKYKYQYINSEQHLDNSISIYPTSYFSNTICYDTENSKKLYALHQNAASWMDYSGRGRLFHFCRKYDLMKLYHIVEKLHK